MSENYTRRELKPLNCDDSLTGSGRRDTLSGESNEEHMNERVDRLTSRHIAKCLDQLGNTIVPAQMSSIKRSFRFLAEDIKTLVSTGENYDNGQDGFNR